MSNIAEGSIAVWLGNFKSEKEFEDYMKIHYETEAEEDINSQFEKDFALRRYGCYYDRDIVETEMLQGANHTLRELFTGGSYLDDFVQTLDDGKKYPFNVIIRVYDYEYTEEKREIEYKDNVIQFYKNIPYEKIVDLSWMGL